jgi:hypothetical protein
MKSSARTKIAIVCVFLFQAGPMLRDVLAQGIKTGLLTCQVAAGFGWVIGSARDIDCEYAPANGPRERYCGSFARVGIDIGYLGPSMIVWAVVAPSGTGTGALVGSYLGATAQVAAILGGGVNVMTGGSSNSIALQPLSVEGGAGLYVGGGVGSMTLRLSEDSW